MEFLSLSFIFGFELPSSSFSRLKFTWLFFKTIVSNIALLESLSMLRLFSKFNDFKDIAFKFSNFTSSFPNSLAV